MRTLYLIRHGQPLVQKRHTCGYGEDVPLSQVGRRQAEELSGWMQDKSIAAVYASPALRCVQTAQALGLPVQTVEDLREVDAGVWTGLSFDEIKERWPEEYAKRGQSIGVYPPPGGESFAQAGERMEAAMGRLLTQSAGDLAVVAHGGVNRGWLCRLLERSMNKVLTLPQPWGGITEIQTDGTRFFVKALGVRPSLWPSQAELEDLWERYNTPAQVQAHCQAVARLALELAGQTELPVNRALLNAACLLHDLVRDWPEHAYAGGEILTREGWPVLGEIVAAHHDLPEGAGTEASLLYLADKLVQGTERVSLAERFGAKRALFGTLEAVAAWERRYRQARQTAERLGLEVP